MLKSPKTIPSALQHQRSQTFGSSRGPLRQPRGPTVAPARGHHVVRASRESGSFWSGVAIGGVVFGVLGFVFAPQISQALLGDDQRLRLPRFLDEEDEDPEVTKQNLAEKIAQLNETIDNVSSQLKTQSLDEEERLAS